jgi:hypothetical protein
MSDNYRTVTCVLRQVRDNSIMVDHPRIQGWVSVPRSLLHYTDDRLVEVAEVGKDITIRVREWKAEELGLAG